MVQAAIVLSHPLAQPIGKNTVWNAPRHSAMQAALCMLLAAIRNARGLFGGLRLTDHFEVYSVLEQTSSFADGGSLKRFWASGLPCIRRSG